MTSSVVTTTTTTTTKHTFGALWQSLRRCYERNERDLSLAYGYLDCVDTLYANTLRDVGVSKVFLTNVPIDRPEKRDSLIRAATNESIFYAVLTLLPNVADTARQQSDAYKWLDESRIFSTLDERNAIARFLTRDAFAGRRVYVRDNNDDNDDYNNDDDGGDDYNRNNIGDHNHEPSWNNYGRTRETGGFDQCYYENERHAESEDRREIDENDEDDESTLIFFVKKNFY